MTPLILLCSDPLIRYFCFTFRCEDAEMNGVPVRVRAVSLKAFERVVEHEMLLPL